MQITIVDSAILLEDTKVWGLVRHVITVMPNKGHDFPVDSFPVMGEIIVLSCMRDESFMRLLAQDNDDEIRLVCSIRLVGIVIQIAVSSRMRVCRKLPFHAKELERIGVARYAFILVLNQVRYLVAITSTILVDTCLAIVSPELLLTFLVVVVGIGRVDQKPYIVRIMVPKGGFVGNKNEVVGGIVGMTIC